MKADEWGPVLTLKMSAENADALAEHYEGQAQRLRGNAQYASDFGFGRRSVSLLLKAEESQAIADRLRAPK